MSGIRKNKNENFLNDYVLNTWLLSVKLHKTQVYW